MNWRTIRAIVIKDLKEVRQNRVAWIPALIVPLIFAILLPVLMVGLPQWFPTEAVTSEDLREMQQLIEMMPEEMAQPFAGMSLEQMWAVYSTGYLLAPMFLIMPMMFSVIVGAESFVGERERKTMEALLYSPAKDTELFLGKVLAAVLPALVLSWLTYLVNAIVVNLASYSLMGGIWFPLPAWWPLIFWLTPAASVLGISATVLISSRVRTFMEAYQASGSLVILVLGLVGLQISGVLFLGFWTVVFLGALVWLVGGILLLVGIGTFNRSQLIARIQS